MIYNILDRVVTNSENRSLYLNHLIIINLNIILPTHNKNIILEIGKERKYL
jgi:hypothetical protein